jgi:hypothetical protein
MTKRELIAMLQVGYYRLSRENRALILARAGELSRAGNCRCLKGGKGQETADTERSVAGEGGSDGGG